MQRRGLYLLLLQTSAALDCIGGWQSGSSADGATLSLGSAGSREDCRGIVERTCPSANGAVFFDSGSCSCAFDMLNISGSGAESCLFSDSLQRDQCRGGWKAGRGAGGTVELLQNVSSRAECLELCKAQPQGPGSRVMGARVEESLPGKCWCEKDTRPGSVEPEAGLLTCEFTCESGVWATGDGNDATTEIVGAATKEECLSQVKATCPRANGASFVNSICWCHRNMTARTNTDSANHVSCFLAEAIVMETATFSTSSGTSTSTTPPVTATTMAFTTSTPMGSVTTVPVTASPSMGVVTTVLSSEPPTSSDAAVAATALSTGQMSTATTTAMSGDVSSSSNASSAIPSTRTSTSSKSNSGANVTTTIMDLSSSNTSIPASSNGSTIPSTPSSAGVSNPSSSTRLTSSTSTTLVPGISTSVSSGAETGAQGRTTTTSSATTGSTEMWTASTTTSPSTLIAPVAMARRIEEEVRRGVQAWRGGNANGLQATALGMLTVVSLDALRGGVSIVPIGKGSRVALMPGLLSRLPDGSALAVMNTELQDDPFQRIGGKQLAAPVVDVSIFDAAMGNVKGLEEPLFFQINGSDGRPVECRYLELLDGAARWSREGVRWASRGEVAAIGAEGMWCATSHLSIFAFLLQALLGCTNLELLSPEAIAAVREREGWWQAPPAIICLVAVAVMLVLLLLGAAWELWQLRKGITYQGAKSVNFCRCCMTIGPQLIKHRYAAFLVFAKDVVVCLGKGRAKLRRPTLVAAVQRSLAVRTGISVGCVSAHCWNGGEWLASPASLPNTVLCRKHEFYAKTAEEVVRGELQGRCVHHVLLRYAITFLACHPLLDAMRMGFGSMTVLKRGALQVSSFVGVLATNALIFNFSGTEQSWESDLECPISPTSQLFVVVATIVSIAINVVPNTFLLDVAKQVHQRPFWTAIFWALTLVYMLFSTFIVVIALANLNSLDQAKWHRSLEWSMSIKFLGVPAAQALRHLILVEYFIRKDSNQAVAACLGVADPHEETLPAEAVKAAEEIADRGIDAAELVCFASLLGGTVMPEYSPATSTTEEVVQGALRHLCRQPSPQQLSLTVEVVEAQGLRMPLLGHKVNSYLSCTVEHLGPQVHLQRTSLREEKSSATLAKASGSCSWNFKATLPGLELGHMLGFRVQEGGRTMGLCSIKLADLLENRTGELYLRPAQDEIAGYRMRPRSRSCSEEELTGSRDSIVSAKVELSLRAKLVVRVQPPPAYLKFLAMQGVWRRRHTLFQASNDADLVLATAALRPGEGQGHVPQAFSEPYAKGAAPPEILVVHSPNANFLELVLALVNDALGDNSNDREDVGERLLLGDFKAVLELLKQRGSGKRYVIDAFAMVEPDRGTARKDFLAALPTVLRRLKRNCCGQIVSEIRKKGKKEQNDVDNRGEGGRGLPQQLLVLDQACQLLKESSCLAEVQLAQSMGIEQRLLLQPEHFTGIGLPSALKGVKEADMKQWPWTLPYMEERCLLQDRLMSMAKDALQRQDRDVADLTDVAVVAVAQGTQHDAFGAYELGAFDI